MAYQGNMAHWCFGRKDYYLMTKNVPNTYVLGFQISLQIWIADLDLIKN